MNNCDRPLVSIIIPVYNAAAYLDEALSSIKKQTYKNLEIICVDDGSTDDSEKIIRKYTTLDKRFKIIKQENKYAGIARNNGLKNSSGDYVIFLDSDDVFERKMIEILVSTIVTEKVDTVVFNYYYFSRNKLFRKKQDLKYKNVKKIPVEIKDEIFQATIGAPWNRFYSRKFIEETGLEFQGTLNSNDIYFTRLTALYSKGTYYLDRRLVNYRIDNMHSLQGNINKSPVSFALAFNAIYDYMKENGFLDVYRRSVEQYAIDLCLTAMNKVNSENDVVQVYEACKKIMLITGITNQHEYVRKVDCQDIVKGLLDDDMSGFVTALFLRYKSGSILKTCIEYRLGKKILRLIGAKS